MIAISLQDRGSTRGLCRAAGEALPPLLVTAGSQGSQEGMQAGFWQACARRDTRDSDRTGISSRALAQCQGLV